VKICFVLPGFARDPIGGVRVVYQYANGLVERGHTVSIAHVARFRRRPGVRDGRPRRQAEEMVGGWRDLRRGAPSEVTWQHVDPAVRMLYVPTLSARYIPDGDVVVATAWQTADGVAALPASKGRGCYLIQHHETWSGREQRVDATWRLPLRKIFIAPWLHARAQGMGLGDLHRVAGAIDTTKFHVATPIADRPRRVAMLYSEWEWKGGPDGIAALVSAREQVTDLRAVFFGAGPRPAGLPEWIEYTQDPRQDALVHDVYNGSSIYLCPSHAEGWHLPPAEAMASGCAVVSTDIDGVADYTDDGVTALLSPVREPEGLTANLVGLLTDDARRVQVAAAGHGSIQRFTWEGSTRDLEGAFAAAPALAAR